MQLRRGCGHWGAAADTRSSLAGRSDRTETTVNLPPGRLTSDPLGEWQVTIKLHRVAGVKSESNTHCSPAWPAHYFRYHFRPRLLPALHTCLTHSVGSPQASPRHGEQPHSSLGSFFVKGERPSKLF